jgi:hypothetical protein
MLGLTATKVSEIPAAPSEIAASVTGPTIVVPFFVTESEVSAPTAGVSRMMSPDATEAPSEPSCV